MEEINEFTLSIRLRFGLNQRGGIGFERLLFSVQAESLNPLMENADEFRIIHPLTSSCD
jgi:hypothetical protein